MLHAIYVRTTPKRSWMLSEAYRSVLSAQDKASELKKTALDKGFDNAEVKIKTFERIDEIPEYIRLIKDEPIRMN